MLEVEDDDGAGAEVSSNGLAGVRVLLYGLFLPLALVLRLGMYGPWSLHGVYSCTEWRRGEWRIDTLLDDYGLKS